VKIVPHARAIELQYNVFALMGHMTMVSAKCVYNAQLLAKPAIRMDVPPARSIELDLLHYNVYAISMKMEFQELMQI
jgi:hypothetical protein